MPRSRLTLEQRVTQIQGDLNTRLAGADALLRFAAINILAVVWAIAWQTWDGAIEILFGNFYPNTAAEDGLDSWGNVINEPRKAATKSSGTVTATGTESTPIPASDEAGGSLLQSASGEIYEITTASVIVSGTATLPIQSRNTGSATILSPNQQLTFVSPIIGINTVAVVDPGPIDGVDQESLEDWRLRVNQRMQYPPQGGADFDFIRWSLEYPGVTRVNVYPPPQVDYGVVGVAPIMDNKTSNPEFLYEPTFDTVDHWDADPEWDLSGGLATADGTQTRQIRVGQTWDPPVDGRTIDVSINISARTAGAVRLEFSPSGNATAWFNTTGLQTSTIVAGPLDTEFVIRADEDFAGSITAVSAVDPTSPIIPSASDLDALADYLENHEDPSTALDLGAPVTVSRANGSLVMIRKNAIELAPQISDLVLEDGFTLPQVEANINAEWSSLLRRFAISGETTLHIGAMRAAVQDSSGVVDALLTSPSADEVVTVGMLLIAGPAVIS